VLSGTAWTFYAEVFPAATRYSGMSLGFNIAVMLGGVSPFVATLLVRLTGSPLTPGYIVIVIGLIGLLTLRTLPETGRTVLRA
jgi:MHS family proline/betaine transporter-like MFS transporter